MKKFVALLLVLVLVIGVCGSAYAMFHPREPIDDALNQIACDFENQDDPSYAGVYSCVTYKLTFWERLRNLFR